MKKKFLPAYLLTLVNVLGFSILMPVLPFIVEGYGAPKWVYGLLLTLYSAFQFIGAPYLGALSDEKGRKNVLIISQAGTLLSWLIFISALLLPKEMEIYGCSLALLVIAASRMLDGITGGNISVTNAYVADITTKDEKNYIFGYLGGISGFGMIVGPAIGGITAFLLPNYAGTLITAALLSTITLLSIQIWLKETVDECDRKKWSHVSIIQTLKFARRLKEVNPSVIIKQLFAMKFFFSIFMAFYIATIALYLIDTFGFNEKELGYFLFVVGFFLIINQTIIAKLIVRWIQPFGTLLLGLFLTMCGLISITLTDVLWLFLLCYYIMNLGLSLVFPMFNTLISQHADPKKQGEIMGISESISSLCTALFPVIAATVYGIIGYQVYYLMTIFPFTALMIAFIAWSKAKKTTSKNNSEVV